MPGHGASLRRGLPAVGAHGPQPPCLCQRAGDSAQGMSGRLRGKGGGDAAEQVLAGVRAAHQQAHAAGV